jgi:hypothetical protein
MLVYYSFNGFLVIVDVGSLAAQLLCCHRLAIFHTRVKQPVLKADCRAID